MGMGDRGFTAPPHAIADLRQQDAGRFPRWERERWVGECGAIGYWLLAIGYLRAAPPRYAGDDDIEDWAAWAAW